MQETDTIRITKVTNNATEERDDIPVDHLRQLLQIDPFGIVRKRFDTIVDLTALGAVSQIALAVPAGAVIQYVASYIVQTVVASGTTVCIGIGSSSAVNKFGNTTTLVVGQSTAVLTAGSVSTGENIGVVGNITSGGTIGVGNITAGKVHLRVVYDIPTALTS
jgi:hypothetical protein